MANEIRCTIIADGPDLTVWDDPNPVEKMKFEDRLKKLVCGYYTVDDQGRCVIDPGDIDNDTPFGYITTGQRGGKSCVSSERTFGDVTVKVEVCVKHG